MASVTTLRRTPVVSSADRAQKLEQDINFLKCQFESALELLDKAINTDDAERVARASTVMGDCLARIESIEERFEKLSMEFRHGKATEVGHG